MSRLCGFRVEVDVVHGDGHRVPDSALLKKHICDTRVRWKTGELALLKQPRCDFPFTSRRALSVHPVATAPPTASEGRRHVTPSGLLQGYRAVTLRERECHQRHAVRDRINTGVYVFTCVNASGMSEFRAKRRVRGYRRGNQGCCGVNVMKRKDRCWNGRPGAADAA